MGSARQFWSRPPDSTGWPEKMKIGTDSWPLRHFPAATISRRSSNESLGGEESFEGRVVKGTVTAIENDLAVIDVGLKSEGRVPLREFAAPGQKADIKVGDEVEVYVDRVENAMAKRCCRATALAAKPPGTSWKPNSPKTARVEGVIFGRVKGGFTVDLGGAVAFLPGSQVDIRPVRDVTPLMDIPSPSRSSRWIAARQHRRVASRDPRRDPRRTAFGPDPDAGRRPGDRRRRQEHHRLRCVRRPGRHRRPAPRHRPELQARQPPERSDQHR
jgi:hypothetical protein